MNKLKIFLIFTFVTLFVSIPITSAADFNETQDINEFFADNSTNINIEQTNTPGTFYDLEKEINNALSGSTLDLTRDYNNSNSIYVEIDLNKDLIIDGHGHTLDCKSEGSGSLFYSEYGNIILKNLKIINAHNTCTEKGGVIYIMDSAQYTLENCTFCENHADSYGGVIYNEGEKSLTIKNCTFKSNSANDNDGGAIYSKGEIHIENSIFDSNKAYVDGGAIFSEENIFINNCIFKSNRAEGAVISQCYGGAICAKNDLAITNCTFKDNYAEDYGGAIYAEKIYINVNQDYPQQFNSFFINNKADDDKGGAIYAEKSVSAFNTEFSKNSALVDGGAIFTCTNANIHYCLFTSNSASGAKSQCYGGAICAKNDLAITNSTFENNNAEDYGGAIYAENIYINVNQEYSPQFNSFFINNKADDDKGGAIYAEKSVSAFNTEFSKNSALVDGGAIFTCTNANIHYCLFTSNSASGAKSQCYGGAIRAKKDVSITNSTFENNNAEDYGGAIYADNVNINIQQKNNQPFNSFFINNKVSDDNGGAIYASYNVNAINTLFNGNSALVDGGAIYAKDNVVVNNCLFESNKANGASVHSCYGGAIRAEDDTDIINSTFKDNYAENRGGAIYSNTVTLEGTTYFENNIARDHGGAIYTDKFKKDFKNVKFINNKAQTGDGGAIYIDSQNYISISECEFINNQCKGDGGAIYVDSSSSHLWITKNIFSGNSAGKGQSIYNWGTYEQISCNFWAGKNPNSNNKQLTKWGLFSDDYYSDSNPIKLDLVFDVDMNDNYDIFLKVKISFFKSDNSIYDNVFDMSDMNFTVTAGDIPVKTRNEQIDRNNVSFEFTPYTENLVSLHYKGYTLSKLVTIEYLPKSAGDMSATWSILNAKITVKNVN